MFKAIVDITEGTGCGYGMTPHLYINGRGIAMSKSPQKALREAKRLAEVERCNSCEREGLPRGISLIPVWEEIILSKDEQIIYVKSEDRE